MTAAPWPDLWANPVCECNIHIHGPFAPAPTSNLWADLHGCRDVFMCSACLALLKEGFAKRAPIRCSECDQTFATVDDYLTWEAI